MKKYEPILVDQNSKDYPCLLKEACHPPEKLYIKGDLKNLEENFKVCLSVVGSRKMTPYGKRAVQRYVKRLASAGITIVSGFMYGIDAEAHRAALSVGGKTIAVMPCGINRICPSSQRDLYYELLDSGGLVISEYPGETSEKKWTFPKRNRIVAGLSQAVLVVEAGKKSGTLITANYARKSNRKTFVVPGSIFSANSEGIYQLVEKGATVAYSPFKIKEFYEERSAVNSGVQQPLLSSTGSKVSRLDKIDEEILAAIKASPLSVDELILKLKEPAEVLIAKLTSLSLKGLIIEEGDKYYVG